MDFDFWQRWGIDLDDRSFANAFVALGLERAALWDAEKGDGDLKSPGSKRAWNFPDPEVAGTVRPAAWADRWAQMRQQTGPLRLRIHGAPAREPILPWYRMLREAQPSVDAVSLAIAPPRADLHMEWPLRFGSLAEDAAGVLKLAAHKWPSSKLARSGPLGRDRTDCDFLLFKGHASELLRALLAEPARLRANVVLLLGGDEGEWGEIRAMLVAVLDRLRASGFVLFSRKLGDEALANTLNGIVEQLSHGNPLDVALELSSRDHAPGDMIAGFTPMLTRFVAPQLARRYGARMAALPPGTELDLSGVGRPDEWLAPGVLGAGLEGGTPRADVAKMAKPPDDLRVAAHTVSLDVERMTFDRESEGGSRLVEVADAVAAANPPEEAKQARAARFLQQQSFVRQKGEYRKASEGFIAGMPAMVRVRIAAPEAGWDVLPTAFPVEKLPKHLERWKLTVWLTELDHLPGGIRGQIMLPRDGDSTECEFRFKPKAEHPRFEGRITVLHRGRVIQTAMLRAGVIVEGKPLPKDGAPQIGDEIRVRHRLGNLEERRQFDLAFVVNHDSKGRPRLAAVSDKAAWVKDLTQLTKRAGKINSALSKVAMSVEDYAKGLDGEEGRKLLIQLAFIGVGLKTYLDEQLDGGGNHPAVREKKYIQIVSTRSDAVVPLEFVYDYAAPEDDAKPCANWRKALENGACDASCDHGSSRSFCPMGFWGLSKVIERHAVTPGLAKDGNLMYLQSETSRESDTLHVGGVAVFGASARVSAADVAKVEAKIGAKSGVAPQAATTWQQWEQLVTTHRPGLIVSLPHTDGKDDEVSLEISNDTRKTIQLKPTHVFPPPIEGRQAPLVALLGCDTAGTAEDCGSHVVYLRACGAGIVVGTIATVFGGHAANVACELVEGLPKAGAPPEQLGELIRAIRRKSLLGGLLMPLCVVAYGDADWKIAQ